MPASLITGAGITDGFVMAEWNLCASNAQDLTNTAWAFATAGQPDAKLFMALTRMTERRLGDFGAQALANTAWAVARAEQPDAQVFLAFARMAERCMGEFNA